MASSTVKTFHVKGWALHFQLRWPLFTAHRGHCLCDINAVLAGLNRKYLRERRLGRGNSMTAKVVVNAITDPKR